MKIYFYDGDLEDMSDSPWEKVDAKYGPSANLQLLGVLYMVNTEEVLTNSLVALSHERGHGYDHHENHTDIYLWIDELHRFIRIDHLTNKEIRYAHNIEKMYLAGAFQYVDRPHHEEKKEEVTNEESK